MARRVAIVDTGTNSTRLLVADVEGETLREVVRKTRITRLGEGVAAAGVLQQRAKERVRSVFDGYRKITAYLEAEDTLLLATSSIRDTADGEVFIAGLARKAAFDYRILTGSQEAELAFTGASIGQPCGRRMVVADIGGGSTELAAGSDGQARRAVSLDIGCVRLSERFLRSDPPGADELRAAAGLVDRMLSESAAGIFTGAELCIGVAGTVTSLAAMDLGLEQYDRDLVHGHVLSTIAVKELTSTLAARTVAELRRDYTVLEAGRADVILAGALILERLLDHAGAEEIIVSENDILDGAAIRYRQHKL